MYNSIHVLEKKVTQLIAAGKYEQALYTIQSFVEHIVYLPQGAGNILSSSVLDCLCQEIGQKLYLKPNANLTAQSEIISQENLIIYIATQLYTSGGHTAVIEDFIRYQPDKKHCIVMTDIFNLSDKKLIEERFANFPVTFIWAPKTNLTNKILWLQQLLYKINPQKVFLFNHHQDVVSIAALQPNLVRELYFFHHADYELCLGVHLDHALHIDAQTLGYYNCRNKLGVKNNIYWPLVVPDKNIPQNRIFMSDGVLITCSSGSPKKFEVPYHYSYIDLLPKILAITKGKHIHIGKLSKQTLEKIEKNLQDMNIPIESFIHIPWVTSVWLCLLEQNVDLYLSSFPISGGRTTIEVMGSGTPIIMHENYRSEYLGQVYMAYPQAFYWREPQQLFDYLKGFDINTLQQHSKWAREHYEKYYAPNLFATELSKAREELVGLQPPDLPVYKRNELQLFLESYNELNWKNLAKKYLLKIIFSNKLITDFARRGRKMWKEKVY